jgi:hypothetical protein
MGKGEVDAQLRYTISCVRYVRFVRNGDIGGVGEVTLAAFMGDTLGPFANA